jgi:hypothetical protein
MDFLISICRLSTSRLITYHTTVQNISAAIGQARAGKIRVSIEAGFRDCAVQQQCIFTEIVIANGQNELQGDLAMNYKSLEEISSKPSQTKVNFMISNGRLHLDELLYFQPSLRITLHSSLA